MGLIKAGFGSLGGVLADAWRDYFYCDGMPADILVTKGKKRENKRSSNTKGNENIITDGSIIAVADGQCMMIVEQGAIVEFCAEPGEFVFDNKKEPTCFYGGFGKGVKNSWQVLKKRFTFGGEPADDQRIYFFNTKEIVDNKYGTANPVPFRVVDTNVGLDVDIAIKCFGEYSYKLTDPMLFYKNVCGNVLGSYSRDEIDEQLKSEFLTALQPAFAKISLQGIRYSQVPAHTKELADAMNEELSEKWSELRGISVVSVGVSSLKASEEDEVMIKDIQKTAVYKDQGMAAAAITGAQAEAMKSAAKNEGAGGAFMGFAGMNMAMNTGGVNANALFGEAEKQKAADSQVASTAGSWTCSCGSVNTGNFCSQCGAAKPAGGWFCPNCGAQCTGNFCSKCGTKKPE